MKRFFLYAVALLATSAGFVGCAEDKVEPNPVLTADVESFALTGLNETLSVTLTAPGVYEVVAPEWITVNTPAARATNATAVIKLTAHVNDSGAERAGEIVFKSAGLTYAIPVTQAATPAGKYVYNVTSAYGDTYTDTLVVEWSGAAASVFNVGNIDPFFASAGAKYNKGFNYAEAAYEAADAMLLIEPMTEIHMGGAQIGDYLVQGAEIYTFGMTESFETAFANMNAALNYGILYSVDGYQTLYMPGAFVSVFYSEQTPNGSYFDAFNGGITYTRVTE